VTPVVLEGHGVRLEALNSRHEAQLRVASADPSVWTYAPEGRALGPAVRSALRARL
jgi:hypothetical protein